MKIEIEMTVVQWLQEALEGSVLNHEQIMQTIGLFEQAKEMEKQQIIEAYTHDRIMLQITAEQYYKETFNNED